ncbi:MAG: SDR family oxidoreductase, partial [Actinomycetota bacterium]|nr:SDR family oxidoreductase [Actinomycetota bacterium]
MRVAAAEVEGTGVTANSVCPTFVRTPMTVETIENIAAKTGSDLAEAESRLAAATPHGRIIEIDEVVTAVAALIASDDNGQEILLDGGPTS